MTGCVWASLPTSQVDYFVLLPTSANSQICSGCRFFFFLSNHPSSKFFFLYLQYLFGMFWGQYLPEPFCVVKAVCRLSVPKSVMCTFFFWKEGCCIYTENGRI